MNTDLRDTYNRIARPWSKDHSTDTWWVEGMDRFLDLLPKGGSVLDVGCGAGNKSRYATRKGFKVTGIDFSQGLLDVAKEEAPECDFRLLPMEELDTMAETFDGVFAQASLLHIPKDSAAPVVQGMADRLVPGGHIYIAVKEKQEGEPDEGVLKENDYGFEYERFFSYYTMEELRGYLKHARLSVIAELRNPSPSGKTVWLQIIGQK